MSSSINLDLDALTTAIKDSMKSKLASDWVFIVPAEVIILKDGDEAIALDGETKSEIIRSTDHSSVFQEAITVASQKGGGRIIVLPGWYTLLSTINIDFSKIVIEGYSYGHDLFFTNDDNYYGLTNKYPVVLSAVGIDAIKIGATNLVFGIAIKNLAITGSDTESVQDDSVYSEGAGISILKGQCIRIENVHVTRKYQGIYMSAGFETYDDVIDIVFLENLMFSYNVYGINQGGWVTHVRGRNIFGYLNQRSLIKVNPQYDWILENIFSNADSWNATNPRDTPIYIGTRRHVEIRNVQVHGAKGTTLCPVPLMWFDLNAVTEGNTEADVVVNRAVLAETQADAIRVDGTGGTLIVKNIRAGTSYMGGGGTISGQIVYNYSSAIRVILVDGKVSCGQPVPWVGEVKARNLYVIRSGGEGWTEKSGVATITAGATSVTVNHGLYDVPSKVLITPLEQPEGKLWVANRTATSFDIITDVAPSVDLPIAWFAKV